jgi:hypothetical protein
MRAALRRDEARVAAGSGSHNEETDRGGHTVPWCVVLDGKRHRQLYGRYASGGCAEAIARQLRTHGLAALVEGPRL